MMPRRVIFVCVLTLLASQAACSQTFYTQPVGRLDEGVTFLFFEKRADTQPTKVQLAEFEVQRHIGPDQWRTVWWIEGKGRAESLVYGKTPNGFTVETAPVPLDREGQYRVSARAYFGVIGYASVFFAFNPDGSVRVTEAILK